MKFRNSGDCGPDYSTMDVKADESVVVHDINGRDIISCDGVVFTTSSQGGDCVDIVLGFDQVSALVAGLERWMSQNGPPSTKNIIPIDMVSGKI